MSRSREENSYTPNAASADVKSLTPAMRQYVEQKKRVGDAILLFRMGDFYETFYEDAVECSKLLGIALTSRDKGKNPIPLAGIPYHALEGYLAKLVKAGKKVAISEQLEDAKQAKGVVKRDITRIITAGTLTDASLLNERDDNLRAAICLRGGEGGLATVELASGRFQAIDVEPDKLVDELVRLQAAELLVDDQREGAAAKLATQAHQISGVATTIRPVHEFSTYAAEQALLEHFGVKTLAGFGFETINPSVCAAGCIIEYLRETQKTELDHIHSITRRGSGEFVQIDHSTWLALEISQTLRGRSREGSLLHAVDRTVHPIGARKLRRWLSSPLRDEARIVPRQDAIGYFAGTDVARSSVRELLRSMADVERIASRVSLGRASPRDLSGLGKTLNALPALEEVLDESRVALLTDSAGDLRGLDDLAGLLRRAIRDDPPATLREGGIIADGFDAELDRLYAISRDGQSWLAEYQKRQIEETGISRLKVAYNRVFGYYIEISNAQKGEVPAHYVRRQTIKSAERYITDELKKFEEDILSATDKAHELEYRLFEEVRQKVAGHTRELLRVADAVGRVDCVAGLAELAVQRRYVRPEIVDDGRLDIRDGRHPVLDQTLAEAFVPNDTGLNLSGSRVLIITGPNMSGKSTYIRQVATLTLLAQTGSFVPAASMNFSLVDRIFARVVASDEIMRGQSTFMVEMTEAANILHNATKESLVVLDELGRGTSTFDGLSLAWAITEHLTNETGCRTLVATHYHELTELADLLEGVKNYNVAVREVREGEGGEPGVVFLHRIVEGGADKSYGVYVARLAGVPKPVVNRSREILQELQEGFSRESHGPRLASKKTKDDKQLELFHDPAEEVIDALRTLDPERMTPLDALQKLSELKNRLDGP